MLAKSSHTLSMLRFRKRRQAVKLTPLSGKSKEFRELREFREIKEFREVREIKELREIKAVRVYDIH